MAERATRIFSNLMRNQWVVEYLEGNQPEHKSGWKIMDVTYHDHLESAIYSSEQWTGVK